MQGDADSGSARPHVSDQGRFLFPLAAVVLTFLCYLPALADGFIDWDDSPLLLRNPHYRGLGPDQLRWMFTSRLMGHWMPLNWISFGLDHAVWGMTPFGYHLTNLLLHATNAAVVYALASKLLLLSLPERLTSDRMRVRVGAVVAALTFSLHPLRVESVAWVTERRDVLSGLFFLLAIWSLPVILLLLDVYPLRRLGGGPRGWLGPAARAVMLEKLPFVALCAGASALALWAQLAGGSPVPLEALPWSGRLAILSYQLAFYLGKTLVPTNLAILYELRLPLALETWRIALSVATVAAVTACALALRRRVPAVLIAWAAYVVILLPPSGIVQSGYQIAADRYSYLACLGWSMLAGAGVAALGRVAALPAFLVIATLGGLTWTQAKIWHDNETVWRRAVDVDPRSGIARANLGAALSAHGRTEEAMAELREAIRLRPGYPDAHLSLGLMLAQGGDPAGAVPHFSEALRLWPRFAEAHNNLGAALAVQGRRDEALSHFREALRLNPDYAEARNNLGLALAQDGKLREAAEQFARAVALNPEWIDARRNLEQAQRLLGR